MYVKKSLSAVSTEVQKTYDDMIDVDRRKSQEDLVDRWKKMKTYSKVDSVCLAVSAGDLFLQLSSDRRSILEKSSALLISYAKKESDMSSSSKSPSAGASKANKTHVVLGSKGPKTY